MRFFNWHKSDETKIDFEREKEEEIQSQTVLFLTV